MTGHSYSLSVHKLLGSNHGCSLIIAAVWVMLYLALLATALSTTGLSSVTEIAAALST
jgi:hypothetical protein